jgi:hypothetical protein
MTVEELTEHNQDLGRQLDALRVQRRKVKEAIAAKLPQVAPAPNGAIAYVAPDAPDAVPAAHRERGTKPKSGSDKGVSNGTRRRKDLRRAQRCIAGTFDIQPASRRRLRDYGNRNRSREIGRAKSTGPRTERIS